MQDYILMFMKGSSTVSNTVGWPAFELVCLILEFGNQKAVKICTGDFLEGVLELVYSFCDL
jgi:hypothetical protein